MMPWLVACVLVLLWQLGCVLFAVPTNILPSPSAIGAALLRFGPLIGEEAAHTLVATLAGFIVAASVGLVTGAAIGASPLVYSGLYGLLVAFNSVPKVALVPVFVVWFGIGKMPAILTAFSLSFFPVVVAVATALATIEPEVSDVLRSLGATRLQILVKIGMPRSLPFYLASLKVAVTLAFVGAITSETVASNNGIGAMMIAAASDFNVALVFAAVVVVGALGVVMYALFAIAEARFTFWARRGAD